jgi:hypothetical protein
MEEYKRQFFDIWFQSVQIMKDREVEGAACNEGIWFVEE